MERGFEKLCREMDDKINAEKGEAAARPLTLASVEQYLQVGQQHNPSQPFRRPGPPPPPPLAGQRRVPIGCAGCGWG